MTTEKTDKLAVIRPGILVSLKSTVTGGVTYIRTDLQADGTPVVAEPGNDAPKPAAKPAPKKKRGKKKGEAAPEAPESSGDTTVERWETTKIVEDANEFERATKVRNAGVALIRKQCSSTGFGLLCPEGNEDALNAAIRQARALADAHNDEAVHTRVHIYALKGRIASTDEEAARAISEEVRSLLDDMSRSIDKLDAKGIRAAATRAREIEAMLAPVQAEKVNLAVEQARKAARMIVARIEKDGKDAASVLDEIARGHIEKARVAFLEFDTDLENREEIGGKPMPAVEAGRFAQGLDFAIGEGN